MPARPVLVGLTVLVALAAGPATATAHDGGLVPYRYVSAPEGVTSAGTPTDAERRQPTAFGGTAETPDLQLRLRLPDDWLTDATGAVTVQLAQLDPADLPPLPAGLEAEGNVYSVAFTGVDGPVTTLTAPGEAVLAAPASPTAVLMLRDGGWVEVAGTTERVDGAVSSTVALTGPATWLQVYEPGASGSGRAGAAGLAAIVLAAGGGAALRRRRLRARPDAQES